MTSDTSEDPSAEKSLEELVNEALEEAGDEKDDPDAEHSEPELTLKAPVSDDHEARDHGIARITIDPATGGAATLMRSFRFYSELEFQSLVKALSEQTEALKNNDLSRAEEMLAVQTHTLDGLFNQLTTRALRNANAGYLDASEKYLKLALRAQSQCRSTWEAVSAIKNPPVIGYAKQANFGVNQQVNNDSRVEKTENPPTELSGGPNELRENPGAPRIEKKADSTLETLGEVHRAEITGGEG